MSAERVLLILNPVSGRKTAKAALYPIVEALSAQGCDTVVHLTTFPGDAAQTAQEQGGAYDRILCCGGDGTLSEVLGGLVRSGLKTSVGYIPAGTTNDLAHALHLPTDLAGAIHTAVCGTPRDHDVGLLNGQICFDYVASFGAFADTAYATNQDLKNHLGRAAYIVQGAKDLFSLKPIPLTVTAGDRVIDGEFYYGSISNSTRIGGIIDLTDTGVCFDDGEMEILLVRQPPSMQALHDFREHHYNPDYLHYFRASEAAFRFRSPTEWCADGEYAGAFEEVTFRILPRAASIIS